MPAVTGRCEQREPGPVHCEVRRLVGVNSQPAACYFHSPYMDATAATIAAPAPMIAAQAPIRVHRACLALSRLDMSLWMLSKRAGLTLTPWAWAALK
jgi:hypothetical protein